MRLLRHTDQWWFEPDLPRKRVTVPKHLRHLDPVKHADAFKVERKSRVGGFAPSRKWARYSTLQSIDVGYLVPVYDLAAIAKRYGLSEAGKRYYRKYILPEPFDIVRRRSVSAHHWSRFTLMAMDVVLKDLEKRGTLQFLKTYHDHIQLLHTGVEFMADYYASEADRDHVSMTDKFGVQWLQR